MLSIMVIDEHPMNKYIAAQRWTAFANCPVNLCESLMRHKLTVAANWPEIPSDVNKTILSRDDILNVL